MKKILIIEDNLSVRENLAEILELSNYNVIAVENGKKGVEKAFSELPDIILCDVMMPELDGYGVLKIINSNPKTRDIPFLFLTAKTEKDDFRRGMGLGADDYITKPFDDVALMEAIEMRLKKSDRIRKSFNTSDDGRQLFLDESRAKAELIKLTEGREQRKYQKKDLIFEEGHFPTWLFYLINGHVKVLKTNEYGKDLITRIYRPGEFFGFLSLIKNGSYQESAKAITDCEVKLIPKVAFFELLYNNRDFSAQFVKILATEILQLEEKLIELAYSSVRKKVANALLHLYVKMEDENHHIVILREDLASLAGTAKETVIRTLADFKEEQLIDIIDHDIVILNLEKLRLMPQ
jgi:CheY-like chemotaxis protein